MQLTKHHGFGNDFLIALDTANGGAAVVGPELARRLCDRHTGVGADGLIHGIDGDDVVTMVLYNSDGSRAEISGNGLRCLAQAVALRRDAPELDLVVDTDAGRHRVDVRPGPDESSAAVVADMGVVVVLDGDRYAAAAAVVEATLAPVRIGRATIGNPHVVAEVDDLAAADLAVVGPAVEAAGDGGVNLELIRPRPDGGIDFVVWERGAGITQACGSGACVAAAFAHEWGLAGETVEVVMPGGTARVHLDDQVRLEGPVTLVAAIEVPDE